MGKWQDSVKRIFWKDWSAGNIKQSSFMTTHFTTQAFSEMSKYPFDVAFEIVLFTSAVNWASAPLIAKAPFAVASHSHFSFLLLQNAIWPVVHTRLQNLVPSGHEEGTIFYSCVHYASSWNTFTRCLANAGIIAHSFPDVLMALACFAFAFLKLHTNIKMLKGLSNNVWHAGLIQLGWCAVFMHSSH